MCIENSVPALTIYFKFSQTNTKAIVWPYRPNQPGSPNVNHIHIVMVTHRPVALNAYANRIYEKSMVVMSVLVEILIKNCVIIHIEYEKKRKPIWPWKAQKALVTTVDRRE